MENVYIDQSTANILLPDTKTPFKHIMKPYRRSNKVFMVEVRLQYWVLNIFQGLLFIFYDRSYTCKMIKVWHLNLRYSITHLCIRNN